jgi:nicotinate phosphoribosyltransferase
MGLLRTENVIRSLADTDLYKLTMMQVVFEKYMNVSVQYDFKCRNIKILDTVLDKEAFVKSVNKEIDNFCSLRFTDDELQYLSTLRYFKPGFIEFLRMFRLNRSHTKVYLKNNDLAILVKGPWFATIPVEVPVLAIVSELYSGQRRDGGVNVGAMLKDQLMYKIQYINNNVPKEAMPFLFINDMGTRRRYSYEAQRYILETMVEHGLLSGTSNIHFAQMLGIKVIGTMAHEYICAHQQLARVEDCQRAAFQAWAEVYRGDLGIALSDTVGFAAFLRDFDLYFAKLFDGARHDSGDPYDWCNKLIEHYNKLTIDPRTKIAVFSDGLKFPTMVELFLEFYRRIKVSFGIGTDLTNDVGLLALQIVMKMTECNGRPVAKVADSVGKGMCLDAGFETYVHNIFK